MQTVQVTIGNDQKVPVVLLPKDHAGNPVSIFGVPSWYKVSGDAGMDIAPGGLSATLISQSVLDPDPANNISVFQVDADASPVHGENVISAQVVLTVVPAMAETLNPTPGTPVQK